MIYEPESAGNTRTGSGSASPNRFRGLCMPKHFYV